MRKRPTQARSARARVLVVCSLLPAACSADPSIAFVPAPWAAESSVVLLTVDDEGAPAGSVAPRLLGPASGVLSGLAIEPSERLLALEYARGGRGARGLDICNLSLGPDRPLAPIPDRAFVAGPTVEDAGGPLVFESTAADTAWRPQYAACDGTPCDQLLMPSFALDVSLDVSDLSSVALAGDRVAASFNLAETQEGRVVAVEYPNRVLWSMSSTTAKIVELAFAGGVIFGARYDGAYLEIDPETGRATSFPGHNVTRLAAHPDGFVLAFSDTSTFALELRPNGEVRRSLLPMPGPRRAITIASSDQMIRRGLAASTVVANRSPYTPNVIWFVDEWQWHNPVAESEP